MWLSEQANAVGPFAAIWYVYKNQSISSSIPVPKWVLAIGGAGIVVGLATYGYNIIRVGEALDDPADLC
jgi:solute carrier family 20 (sodium-dependent phosphate transporter)